MRERREIQNKRGQQKRGGLREGRERGRKGEKERKARGAKMSGLCS